MILEKLLELNKDLWPEYLATLTPRELEFAESKADRLAIFYAEASSAIGSFNDGCGQPSMKTFFAKQKRRTKAIRKALGYSK